MINTGADNSPILFLIATLDTAEAVRLTKPAFVPHKEAEDELELLCV